MKEKPASLSAPRLRRNSTAFALCIIAALWSGELNSLSTSWISAPLFNKMSTIVKKLQTRKQNTTTSSSYLCLMARWRAVSPFLFLAVISAPCFELRRKNERLHRVGVQQLCHFLWILRCAKVCLNFLMVSWDIYWCILPVFILALTSAPSARSFFVNCSVYVWFVITSKFPSIAALRMSTCEAIFFAIVVNFMYCFNSSIFILLF